MINYYLLNDFNHKADVTWDNNGPKIHFRKHQWLSFKTYNEADEFIKMLIKDHNIGLNLHPQGFEVN